MTIEETLISQYGPLLSLTHLAHVLDRSPEGLRISLRTASEWSGKINSTRIKIGRRVYFRTTQVAVFLNGE
jgi:hypothetical protein